MLLYSAVYPHYKRCIAETMATGKTTTLTFRIEPALKEGLRAAAVQEHRSIANMIAVMIRDYCGRVGVEISAPGAPSVARQPPAKGRRSSPKSK